MKKTNIKKVGLYFLSFFIPFAIAFFVFYSNSISGFPFSGLNTILTYDLQYEMIPLYGYLSHLGIGFNNLFFSTTSGLGGDFFCGFALSVSPTDFIYRFVPLEYLPDAIFWSTIIKIGFCGLSFYIFTQKSKKIDLPELLSIVFSGCYALMSYNFTYSSMPMWADLVILLPLLAICVERLAAGEKSFLFVILLAFSIIDNYYIAYMVIITLCIFYLFNLFEKKTDTKTVIRNCVRFSYHLLLALGISLFVLFPVVYNLMGGKLSGNSEKVSVPVIINSLGTVIRSMFSMNYSNLELNQPPNIFCGSFVVLFFILWFISKEKTRTKVLAFTVFAFYLASFIFGALNSAWHGFSAPVGYCSRFSFTYCFFAIYFACRFLSSDFVLNSSVFIKYKKLLYVIFSVFTYIELFINDSFIISNISEEYIYQNRNEYLRSFFTEDIVLSSIRDDKDLYRCAKNFVHTNADGMMYGYNDLAFYNSSFDAGVSGFLSNLGLYAQYNLIGDYGLTPPLASLLNVKYYVSYYFDTLDYYDSLEDYGIYHVFKNDDALPIAFMSNASLSGDLAEFSDDPFDNINKVYDDLFSPEDLIFVEQNYTILNDNQDDLEFSFVPETDGHYFFYRTDDKNSDLFSAEMLSEKPILNFYVNGNKVGGYCLYNRRYCADLGSIKAGQEIHVALEENIFDSGKIYLYYYNSELMNNLAERVSGYHVEDLGWQGMTISGNNATESDLMLTLPYLRGYDISINGVKAEYSSYRDALLLLHLPEGNNDIKISYIPYGFRAGTICSIIFFLLTLMVFYKKRANDTGDGSV